VIVAGLPQKLEVAQYQRNAALMAVYYKDSN
jgi:hypothetical protein